MVKKSVVLFVCVVLVFCGTQAMAGISWKQAEEIVKELPCSKGGTLDQYFSEKAEVPALEDLGWIVYQRDYGFEVERMLVLDQNTQLLYKWSVDSAGNAKPLNGKAMGITPEYFSPKPKDKTPSGRKDSFEDWPPYRDYLKLNDKYKSAAYEESLRESYKAETIVRGLPCSKGGTLDQYFSKKPEPPASDLGWNIFDVDNGYDVVRTILIDQYNSLDTLEYRWHVDPSGIVTPLNSEARGITSGSSNPIESGRSTTTTSTPKPTKKKEISDEVYKEAKGRFRGMYKAGDSVKLRNSSDDVVAVYGDAALTDVTIFFSNGSTAKILEVGDGAYRVEVAGRSGWIPEGVIVK